MRFVRAVDRWCRRGDFTTADLAVFRILYGASVLTILPSLERAAAYPTDDFDPPLGPMMLFDRVPPVSILTSMEVAIALLAALLLVGFQTRAVSLMLSVGLMVGYGFLYSFGKIDHTVILVFVPAVMAFTAWGDDLSVDHRAPLNEPKEVAQWPLRVLALLIAMPIAQAGYAKASTGWPDLKTHAVQGHMVPEYFKGRDGWLAPYFLDLRVGPVWEALDWMTLIVEIGVIVAVLSWVALRITLALMTVFHLAVLLMMNITFATNVIGYAAFFRWGRLFRVQPGARLRFGRPAGLALAALLGVGAYGLHEWNAGLQWHGQALILLVGGAAAVVYLAAMSWKLVTGRTGRVTRP